MFRAEDRQHWPVFVTGQAGIRAFTAVLGFLAMSDAHDQEYRYSSNECFEPHRISPPATS
jgi:hypothetical protein